MWSRLRRAAEQFGHLAHEARQLNGDKWWRWGSVWFNESFQANVLYRIDRGAYLAFGDVWSAARVALAPARFAMRPWAPRCDIHYRADIGRGFRILHPALGAVISGNAIIGENLVLVGGNCIGNQQDGPIVLGDDVVLGANASVIGPLTIGSNVRLGSCALVTRDVGDNEVMLAPLAQPRRTS